MGGLGKPKGSFHLFLERSRYLLGETIHGQFVFSLNEPTKVRRIDVELQARASGREFYRQTVPLDGQRHFYDGNYPFALVLPRQIKSVILPTDASPLDGLSGFSRVVAEGALGAMQRKVGLETWRLDQLEWTVTASFQGAWLPSKSLSIAVAAPLNVPEPAPLPRSPRPGARRTCVRCGPVDGEAHERFCTRCGTAFGCPCGQPVEAGDRFCMGCGKPTGQP